MASGEQVHQPLFADEAPSVDTGQGLCKHARPEGFNTETSCFDEGIDLILLDHHLVLLKDEGRVDANKLRDRGHVSDFPAWC